MPELPTNPFNATKSVDLTDEEINTYWVDLGEGAGFVEMFKPTSPMPMLILGSKGSGKTHIMRYFSFQLQQLRHSQSLKEGLSADRYLGVYMRCSGLNSSRFQRKGIPDNAWEGLFAYYIELWLAQILLDTCRQAIRFVDYSGNFESELCRDIVSLFDSFPGPIPESVGDLVTSLRRLQQDVDLAVNNCILTKSLNVNVLATPGRLVFGIPRIVANRVVTLDGCLFLYLIDEFENLTEPQQKHINTLIREREGPCSFKIGSRLYGVRTHATYSADEENKEGSEYEVLPLDERLRKNKASYTQFARRLLLKRLEENGYYLKGIGTTADNSLLSAAFAETDRSGFAEADTSFVLEKYKERERPYFARLRAALTTGITAKAVTVHGPA